MRRGPPSMFRFPPFVPFFLLFFDVVRPRVYMSAAAALPLRLSVPMPWPYWTRDSPPLAREVPEQACDPIAAIAETWPRPGRGH